MGSEAHKLLRKLFRRSVMHLGHPSGETQQKAIAILDKALATAYARGAREMKEAAIQIVRDSWDGESYDDAAAKCEDVVDAIRALPDTPEKVEEKGNGHDK